MKWLVMIWAIGFCWSLHAMESSRDDSKTDPRFVGEIGRMSKEEFNSYLHSLHPSKHPLSYASLLSRTLPKEKKEVAKLYPLKCTRIKKGKHKGAWVVEDFIGNWHLFAKKEEQAALPEQMLQDIEIHRRGKKPVQATLLHKKPMSLFANKNQFHVFSGRIGTGIISEKDDKFYEDV